MAKTNRSGITIRPKKTNRLKIVKERKELKNPFRNGKTITLRGISLHFIGDVRYD